MEQLNYREILNKKFKVFSGKPRIFKEYKILESQIEINFTNVTMTITYFKNDVVKIFIAEINEEPISTNSVFCYDKATNLTVSEDKDAILIKGEFVHTCINKFTSQVDFLDKDNNIICRDFQPSFIDEDGCSYITKENDAIAYYGLGEKGGSLNKKGTYTENYNTDDPETDDNSTMYYKTIPFYVALKENIAYGLFFDNSFRSYFDMGKSCGDRIFFGSVGGQIQYYFMAGHTIKDVIHKYTHLTGRMEMPPLWSLGYQQCRFSYFTQEEVLELVKTFEEKEIPLDVVYLDIDYMDGFRVMTFKTPHFSNAKGLIKELEEKGIKVVTIVDPGVKIDEEYGVYKRGKIGGHFTKKLDGELFVGAVWAGDCAFPDFSNKECREWWKSELKYFINEYGISGIWNDMNEPCVFNNDYKTLLETCLHNSDCGIIQHKEFHNRYGMEMSRASYEAQNENGNNRGFSMTRATYAGGQRYSSVWTGDNMSLWSQLRMSISMNANLGISGFSFVGNDVSGFGLDSSEELFIRWSQVGTFLPILRNHSNMYTRRQEPWAFGSRAEKIVKKTIELRYEIIPYLYDMYYLSHTKGLPIFRPMIMEFQNDINLIDNKEQFMFGNSILVAPVLYEGERSKVVYLPKGNWYNYFTNEKFKGGENYQMECQLDEILVFVKEGSIIPTYKTKYKNMEQRPNNILYKIYGEKACCKHYFDDGKTKNYLNGEYNLYNIKFENNKFSINELANKIKEEEFEYLNIV